MERMIRIGSVGTSSIMHVIQEAIRLTDGLSCSMIYSRNAERGREFAELMGIEKSCCDYFEMLNRDDIDVIYIASPNSLHVTQALQAMKAGKHVIVEKPAAVTKSDAAELYEAAIENHVFFFEAVTTLFMPNFTACRALLPQLGRLSKAQLIYGQYSSKYDAYLRGENPNIFNPRMQGGALNDMGIYCIHAAVSLLGSPQNVHYEASCGPNGIDLSGRLLLDYPDLTCEIVTAKDSSLPSGCLFEGENGYVAEDGPLNEFAKCRACIHGRETVIDKQPPGNRMWYELSRFRDAILQRDTSFFESMAKQSLLAASILEQAHRQNGSDQNNRSLF